MLGLVKDEVGKKIGGIDGIPAGKESAVVETTASSLMSGLKNFASPAALGSLLGGGGANATNGLSSGVVSALTSKVGLSPSVAQNIAGTVIPAVTSLFNKHVGDSSKPGFNLQSMAGALMGGSSGGNSAGSGIASAALGALGGLFKKK
jgi:hypothetical protein